MNSLAEGFVYTVDVFTLFFMRMYNFAVEAETKVDVFNFCMV